MEWIVIGGLLAIGFVLTSVCYDATGELPTTI